MWKTRATATTGWMWRTRVTEWMWRTRVTRTTDSDDWVDVEDEGGDDVHATASNDCIVITVFFL